MAGSFQKILKPTRARGLDTSGNNNHAQIYSGRALEFDGVLDYLDGPSFTDIGVTGDVTVSFWGKYNAGSGVGMFWGIYAALSDGMGVVIDRANNTLEIFDDSAGNDIANIYATTMFPNTWYRIVFVLDNSEFKLYMNGVLVGSGTNVETHWHGNWTPNIFLGMRSGAIIDESYAYKLDGMMSDFQVWNSAWTAADAEYDYLNPEQLALNRGGTSLTNSNLKLWYPMNEGHRGNQSYVLDASNTGLGDNVFTNGDFATGDLTGWATSGTVTYSNGGMRLVEDGFCSATQSVGVSGTTYKLTYDVIAIDTASGGSQLQVQQTGFLVNMPGTQLGDSLGTHSIYFTADRANIELKRSGSDLDVTIDNLILEPINAKHNATTVFYGDDKVANGDCTVTDPTTVTINSVACSALDADPLNGGAFDDSTEQANSASKSIKITADSDSNYPGMRWVGGDEMGLVVGRTYYMECYVYMPSGGQMDRAQLKYRNNAEDTVSIEYTGTFDAWTKLSGTFVIPDDITDIQIIAYKVAPGAVSNEFFYVDDISLKEVGVATGWTDADQQLDIPQTALQSYNQLGWVKGEDTTQSIGVLGYEPELDDGSFTLSYSLFTADSSENKRFMAFNETTSPNTGRLIHQLKSDGSLEIFIDDSDDNILSYVDIILLGKITTGKWYHIVESFDRSSNELICYLNGEEQVTLDISTIDANLNFGGTFTPFTYGENLHGSITEIAVFKGVALSSAEVVELYNDGKILDAQTHSQKAALINYWRNNGLATWTDLEGSDDATTNNITETMLITAGVDSSRDSQGFLMNSQRLTNSLNLVTNTIEDGIGIGERALVPGGVDLGTSDFSICFWVKKSKDWTSQWVISQYANDTNRWYIRAQASNPPRFQIYTLIAGGAVHDFTDNGTDLDDYIDSWMHVVCAVDRNAEIKWYVNGALSGDAGTVDGSGSEASGKEGTSLSAALGDMSIGWFEHETFDDHHFNGQIDDVLIYSDYLSAPEVTRIYKAGKRSHK